MFSRFLCVPMFLIAMCLPAFGSQIQPLDLSKLTPQSKLVLLGVVSEITSSDNASDTITVRVVSTVKGTTDAKSFSLRLRNKGVKDFDPKMAVGDQGVFFLKSLEDGKAELTYWGSIAIIQKNINFSVANKPDAVPKASGILEGQKVKFPEQGIADGVKAVVGLLESCCDQSVFSEEELKKAQQGDHIKLEFSKPIPVNVMRDKLEATEVIFRLPMNTGVFWVRSGDKVHRYAKYVFDKEKPFSVWLREAKTTE